MFDITSFFCVLLLIMADNVNKLEVTSGEQKVVEILDVDLLFSLFSNGFKHRWNDTSRALDNMIEVPSGKENPAFLALIRVYAVFLTVGTLFKVVLPLAAEEAFFVTDSSYTS